MLGKKQKVVFFDPANSSAPFNYFLISELCRQFTVQVHCSTTKYNSDYVNAMCDLVDKNVKFYSISKSTNKNIFYRLLAYGCAVFCVARQSKNAKYLIINFPVFFPLDIILFLFFGRKLILVHHNLSREQSRASKLFSDLLFLLSHNHLLVSKTGLAQFMKRHKFLPKNHKILLFEHGPLAAQFEHFNSDFSFPKKIEQIVLPGNVKAYKGISSIINLPSKFEKKAFQFQVIGKLPNSKLGVLLEENGWTVTNGFVESETLNKLFAMNSLFLLPYSQSTQSGMFFTLLHHRCFVICSDRGEQARLLKSAPLPEAVYTFGNEGELAERIVALINQLSDTGRTMERIRNEVKWKPIVEIRHQKALPWRA